MASSVDSDSSFTTRLPRGLSSASSSTSSLWTASRSVSACPSSSSTQPRSSSIATIRFTSPRACSSKSGSNGKSSTIATNETETICCLRGSSFSRTGCSSSTTPSRFSSHCANARRRWQRRQREPTTTLAARLGRKTTRNSSQITTAMLACPRRVQSLERMIVGPPRNNARRSRRSCHCCLSRTRMSKRTAQLSMSPVRDY
mmetsp:Transcript_4051/g.12590  ORF Transcript_4051/g.12590 Transcript_4051/m.12590 type:complete len:201 (+) Transcript_4051:475-1077(+)